MRGARVRWAAALPLVATALVAMAALWCGGCAARRQPKPPGPVMTVAEIVDAHESPEVRELRRAFAEILQDPAARAATWGIEAISLDRGDRLIGLNASKLLRPASVMKIFTTGAALDRLGADFRFETPILALGSLENGLLDGDLVVVGSGDPSLRSSAPGGGEGASGDFARWAAALAADGLTTVTGRLLIDDRSFESAGAPPSWEIGDVGKDFARLTAAFAVDGGASDDDGDPAIHAARLLAEALREEGIAIAGPTVFFSSLTEDDCAIRSDSVELPQLYLHRSPHLLDIVRVVNKRSDNEASDALFKKLGLDDSGQGTYVSGAKAVANWIRAAHPTGPPAAIADGSGLSWHNLVTARQVVAALLRMARSPNGVAFRESLPIAGLDGTLRHRLTNSDARGFIHAKTGYINSTRTLAGYVTARGGERLAFAILTNNYRAPTNHINSLHDAMLAALAEFDR